MQSNHSRIFRIIYKTSSQIFFGLLVTLCFPLFAHSYLDEAIDAIYPISLDSTPLFVDSSYFSSTNSYYHLLNLSKSHTDNDSTLSITTGSVSSQNRGVILYKNWGAAIVLNFDNFYFDMLQKENNEGTDIFSSTPITSGALSFWIQNHIGLGIGVSLGISAYPNIQLDTTIHFSENEPVNNYSVKSPFSFKVRAQYYGSHFHIGGQIYRGLSTSFLPKYTTLPSQSFKTFPTAIVEQSYTFDGGAHGKQKDITLSFSYMKRWGTNLITGKNPLPFVPGLEKITINLKAYYKLFSTKLSYYKGLGYIYGYDNDDYKSRYIRFENIDYHRFYGDVLYSGKVLSGTLFAEVAHGVMPDYGYVDFYPFSSWTIFDQQAYRFSACDMTYQNFGGDITYQKKWPHKHVTRISLRASYMHISAEILRETRKIIVLIPIYIDKTIFGFDSKFLTTDITLQQQFQIRRVALLLSAKQLIIPSSNKSSDEADPEPTPVPPSPTKTKAYGGLKLGLGVTIPITLNDNKKE